MSSTNDLLSSTRQRAQPLTYTIPRWGVDSHHHCQTRRPRLSEMEHLPKTLVRARSWGAVSLMWPTHSSSSDTTSDLQGNSPSARITALVQTSQHRSTEWSQWAKLHSVRPRASPRFVRRVRTEWGTVQPGTLRHPVTRLPLSLAPRPTSSPWPRCTGVLNLCWYSSHLCFQPSISY